jgi:hemerythrin-like domain-containing protein
MDAENDSLSICAITSERKEADMESQGRRDFLGIAGFAISGIGLGVATKLIQAESGNKPKSESVGAVEDLMREHGLLRRALLAYGACAHRLRTTKDDSVPEAIVKIAKLFRSFGEDYHERKLEEAHIFPILKKSGGAGDYPDILITQHNLGRGITDYILKASRNARLPAKGVGTLAEVLDGFILMYQHHAAREDTIVFPAWKKALSAQALQEMGEEFESIERTEFGADGFEAGLKTMAGIEESLGITDISQFNPPAPPGSP